MMPFAFEYIATDSPAEQTPEYREAVKINQGLPLGIRVIDHAFGTVLYFLSTESDEQRPPGEYLLFYKGHLIKIRAYVKVQWVDGVGDVATYRIYSLDIPPAIQADRDEVVSVIRDGLEAKGRGYPVPPAGVKIEFI